jgi:DNA-binding XRE family transcriptional regulator
MRQRCHYPADIKYRWYGGRGIKVCDRWRWSFKNFVADMGRRPIGLTIHRRDNDLGYEPGNCVWATREEQNLHRVYHYHAYPTVNILTQQSADTMDFQQVLATAVQKATLPALATDLLAVAHKLRYPMAAILAKVPGDTLAERARQIGVSRQTMYVWAQERFRPSTDQARIIADLTSVPIEQIMAYQEGKDDGKGGNGGARKPARKTRPRLAKASRSLPAGAARLRAKSRRVALEQGKRGHARTLRKRTGKRPVGGEGV